MSLFPDTMEKKIKTTANQITGNKIFCVFFRTSLENRYIAMLGIKMHHGKKFIGKFTK